MKNVHHVRTKQHGGLKSSLSQSRRNSTISQSLCAGHHRVAGSCNQQQKSSYSNNCAKAIILGDFCGSNGKTSTICQQWSRWNSPSKQGSYSATVSTSWDEQACTHDASCRQYYITTSKKYLINSHILLKYFELVFLQLQLVKMSHKLIIVWVNYEKNKKGSLFYETPCTWQQHHNCQSCSKDGIFNISIIPIILLEVHIS